MVNCLSTLKTTFLILSSVHKYQTKLASLQKYYLPGFKTSLGQLYSIWVTKFGKIFLKIWSFSRLIHTKHNLQKSCHLAKIPVDFCFISLTFSAILFLVLFSLNLLPPQLLVSKHVFLPLFFCGCCFYLFYLKFILCILSSPLYCMRNVFNQELFCVRIRAGWAVDALPWQHNDDDSVRTFHRK